MMSYVAFNELLKECSLLLKMEPTEETLDRFSQLVQDPTLRQYAFFHLGNPAWIQPLFRRGFFSEPPTPARDEESKTVSFPFWPESQYLARMASVDPAAVSEVIQHVPLNENPSVFNDLIRAALVLPTNLAAAWTYRAIDWLNRHVSVSVALLDQNLGQLISHLAQGGEVKPALDLAKSVLAVLPDPRAEEKQRDQYSLPLEPRAHLHLYDYRNILNKNYPQLVSAAGIEALIQLCDLLEDSIVLTRGSGEEGLAEDYSYIWHPDIEEDEDNGVSNLLVTAVRQAAIQIATNNPNSIREVVNTLDSRRWRVFHRIALHLLKLFPDVPLVVQRVTDKSLFDEMDALPEYGQLVQEHFSLVPRDRQKIYLEFVEAGPGIDAETFKGAREKWFGVRPSDEDYETYVKAWKRDRLFLIRGSLTGHWEEYLSRLITELGEPSPTESARLVAADVIVDQSPKSPGELASMSAEEITSFLNEWRPTPEASDITQEGLANTLTTLAASEPNKLARVAEQYERLAPVYIRALLWGFRQAVEGDKQINWHSILRMCKFVVDNTYSQGDGATASQKGLHDSHQMRRGVASLFLAGLRTTNAGIPYEFRPLIWEVLKPLTEDPDPTPELEAKYGGSNMDPATLSLNTNRGEAMHALIRYALWVRKHFEGSIDSAALLKAGLEQMPEVREVLDHHLEPSHDPALSIRAVYGQWFPWLSLIDYEWASKSVNKIFPEDEASADFWYAAWQTYVVFCSPYDNVFDLLQEEYLRAVDRIGSAPRWEMRPRNADSRLVEHIYTLYWRGKVDLDKPDGLLERFLHRASDDLRGHGIGFTGRSLCNTKEPVPDRILKRLVVFIESRITRLTETSSAESNRKELVEFGWWYVSGKFDEVWAISTLKRVLSLTGWAEPEHQVAERLAKAAESMTLDAVECIDMMIKGAREPWQLYSLNMSARAILEMAVKSNDAETQRLSKDAINRLLARGHFEFLDLLG